MLAPMRPRPTIPSCIRAPYVMFGGAQGLKPALCPALSGTAEAVPFPIRSMSPVLLQNLFYQFGQFTQSRLDVAAEVYAQRPPLALKQNLEIAARLRRL